MMTGWMTGWLAGCDWMRMNDSGKTTVDHLILVERINTFVCPYTYDNWYVNLKAVCWATEERTSKKCTTKIEHGTDQNLVYVRNIQRSEKQKGKPGRGVCKSSVEALNI